MSDFLFTENDIHAIEAYSESRQLNPPMVIVIRLDSPHAVYRFLRGLGLPVLTAVWITVRGWLRRG